jgi:hypothetical protein
VQSAGTLLEYNDWYATLLRLDYVQLLNDSLNGVPARGRFALTVLAVSNAADEPRRIPRDLFSIVDNDGRVYRPIEGASSAYLENYQRGEHGDLALEDQIPPGGAMFSVPIIFDVAPDATELILTMGPDAETGWRILQLDSQTGEPLPTSTPAAGP